MKTKNILIVAALLIGGMLNLNSAFAQDAPTNKVTLNIKLNPIQTLVVTPGQETVNLEYTTIDDYSQGVSQKVEDHLTVFSTGGFKVIVNSGKFSALGTRNIEVTDVTVLAENGTNNKVVNNINSAVTLGSENTLISSSEGGRNLKYNVTYNNELGKNDAYINLYKAGSENTFTTEVTYTIVAN